MDNDAVVLILILAFGIVLPMHIFKWLGRKLGELLRAGPRRARQREIDRKCYDAIEEAFR